MADTAIKWGGIGAMGSPSNIGGGIQNYQHLFHQKKKKNGNISILKQIVWETQKSIEFNFSKQSYSY